MNETAENIEQEEVPTNEAEANEAPATEEKPIEEVVAHIKANYDFNVNVKPTVFHFKTQVDKDTGIKKKRPSLTLALPMPSVQGIVDILEKGDAKEMELLIDTVENVIIQHARQLITDDESITAETLPVEKLSWNAISYLPKPERTGGGIPKETWEAFVADYIDVMPEATGKTPEQVALAGKLLMNKFSSVKTNMPVLELMQQQLAIYAETSQDAENYTACIEFLTDKLESLLNVTDEDLLAGL